MKTILGLDLGTNSVGWALVDKEKGNILGLGSRIIPMPQDLLSKFDTGQSISQTAERTGYRSVRRLRERHLLRRERLHRVLNILGFLPEHYTNEIDFEKRLGKFIQGREPKLVYKLNAVTNKVDFIFQESFREMLSDFAKHQPQLTKNNKKVPFDWTIYYLRKKALTNKIQKEELAWLLLHFNQKRGYYQLRGEEDEDGTRTAQTRIYFTTEVIESITDTKQVYKEHKIYRIKLSNGDTGKYYSKVDPNWLGLKKNIIVTIDTDKDGNDKLEEDGSIKRKFSIPTEDDWEKKWKLIKIKTENEINISEKTVGSYIYDTLLINPNQKIKGKLVRTIERKFYKEELQRILDKQQEFHAELKDQNLYRVCLEELYEYNESHRNNIAKKDFTHLFLNDIIFYQRPLKSKKSLISDCRYESRIYKSKDGKTVTEPIKCIAKSHPLFQELRLWKWVMNLSIYERGKKIDGKLRTDVNVTSEFLSSDEDKEKLFAWLNSRKDIEQKPLLKYFGKSITELKYRWNYVEDKIYPCNETRAQILSRLAKVENIPANFLTKETEEALWHILYSISDKNELSKALKTFAEKNKLGDDFVEQFRKFPPFKNEYGAYSSKAIKMLLPLMRMGKYWSENNIDSKTKERIDKIITGEFDAKIQERVRDKAININELNSFKGLPEWLACYVVYNRYSEEGEVTKWKTSSDISRFLKDTFKQHSLRNPIVEQVISETLRVVIDIWNKYGNGEESFFDEIHIELGREMKNPADKRKQMTEQITSNENTNLRIKSLLVELLNDKSVENVRPYSPSQQEILKIYEDCVLNAEENVPDDILKISEAAQPTKAELIRYKLWLEQKYRSPYTGEIIPLNKLFTTAYEIEHIIPQSRYFDDSFSNKVICEAEVNKDKDDSTGYEYIKDNSAKKIELSFGKTATLFTIEAYEAFVKKSYEKSRSKMKKLLMDDIPESFIQRQLNDSRYISKVVKNLLSNIVRDEGEQETTSRNVIASNGSITSTLKQDWGLNGVWNEIITPRFERLNQLTNSTKFGNWTDKEGKKIFQTQIPLELSKGFSKKRIDHRHHALDALIIACATRSHINYLNNEYAKANKKDLRYDLRNKLCFKKYNDESKKNYKWVFHKPWETFTKEAKDKLSTTIISFKQNLRVINKTVNWYEKYIKDETGIPKKQKAKQEKGDSWAIRKPMHKATVAGAVKLRLKKTVSLSLALDTWESITNSSLRKHVKELVTQNYDKNKLAKYFKDKEYKWNDIDISKVEICYWDNSNVATRIKIDENFNASTIESITDTGIQKILLKHLSKFNKEDGGKIIEQPEFAFSVDGIDEMNKNIVELNGGEFHHSVYKVRAYEPKGNKFNVGTTGNKKDKFVEAAKGTNLFFAIYIDKENKRYYESIPFNIIVERQKQGLPSVPELNNNGHSLLFYLSPNDLVFVPSEEEKATSFILDPTKITNEQIKRIYKFTDGTGTTGNFIQHQISALIFKSDKKGIERLRTVSSEFLTVDEDKNKKTDFLNEVGKGSTNDKNQKSFEGIMIKEFCMKIKVDRLGNISPIH